MRIEVRHKDAEYDDAYEVDYVVIRAGDYKMQVTYSGTFHVVDKDVEIEDYDAH